MCNIIYLSRGTGMFGARDELQISYIFGTCGPRTAGPSEVVMQTIGLVIMTVIGMALVAGLSMTLYMVLPQSVLECSAHHGRFAGLDTRERGEPTPTGTPSAARLDVRLGQPA